jgi:hypothetical protein
MIPTLIVRVVPEGKILLGKETEVINIIRENNDFHALTRFQVKGGKFPTIICFEDESFYTHDLSSFHDVSWHERVV